MKQAVLLDLGPKPARPPCSTCGGPRRARGRCRPCEKDHPAPGGSAWRRWTRGIDRVLRARLDGAGLDRFWVKALAAVLGDEPIPPEVAPLVADLARLPCSPRRYRRKLDQALTRSQIGQQLYEQGLRGTARDPHRVDNIAGRAAELIWAQRDRVAAGEVFERRHDAELVEQAVLEDEAREQLRARGLRGARVEAAVVATVARAMEGVWGTYGRPRALRVAVEGLRIAVDVVCDEEAAAEEAAEVEAAAEETAQKGAATFAPETAAVPPPCILRLAPEDERTAAVRAALAQEGRAP